ncbi:MAG: S-layer homology domain-containing protein [Acidimicrobiales bacterium]
MVSSQSRLLPTSEASGIARRRFLQGALAAGGAAALVPGWLDAAASAAAPLHPSARLLVVVYLNGGNDHLNTLVPAEDGAYHRQRGSMAVSVDDSTAIGEGLFLNPVMPRLKARYDTGRVAFVRGVGEASDDRSHFTSAATWMSGKPGMLNPTGWLGRFVDGVDRGGLRAVAIERTAPLLVVGDASKPTVLPPEGSLFGSDRHLRHERFVHEALAGLAGGGRDVSPAVGAFSDIYSAAIDRALDVGPAFGGALPAEGFAREMSLAARVANLDLGTQIITTTLRGFDHHDAQRPDHERLLGDLDAGIEEFFAELSPALVSRTAMLVFSEFGRRVVPNASGGTDHGTAGMVMMIGERVKGGLKGIQPSITDLDRRGDMKHHLDFREVHATVLSEWLEADDREILGQKFGKLDLFSAGAGSPGQSGQGVSPTGHGPLVFSDVPADAYYAHAVAWLSARGITTGTGPGVFSPDAVVTRGQMVTFLWRYRGSPTGSPNSGYSDVARSAFYAKAVDWAKAEGVTTGTGGNRFSPEDPVTRAQVATFLWRFEGAPGDARRSAFRDVPRDQYYTEAIDWLSERNITTGTGPAAFSPEDPVTRGQMATFLWRLAGSPMV